MKRSSNGAMSGSRREGRPATVKCAGDPVLVRSASSNSSGEVPDFIAVHGRNIRHDFKTVMGYNLGKAGVPLSGSVSKFVSTKISAAVSSLFSAFQEQFQLAVANFDLKGFISSLISSVSVKNYYSSVKPSRSLVPKVDIRGSLAGAWAHTVTSGTDGGQRNTNEGRRDGSKDLLARVRAGSVALLEFGDQHLDVSLILVHVLILICVTNAFIVGILLDWNLSW